MAKLFSLVCCIVACFACQPSEQQDSASADASLADSGFVDAGSPDGQTASDAAGIPDSRLSQDTQPLDLQRPDLVGSDLPQGNPVDVGYSHQNLVGSIAIREGSHNNGVTVDLYDGPTLGISPEGWFTQLRNNGQCQLWAIGHNGNEPVCEPQCSANHYCSADQICKPLGQFASAGLITVTGLTMPVTLTPSTYGYSGMSFYANDVFLADATVEVTAAGDTIAAFQMQTTGVTDLVSQQDTYNITEGQPLVIRWSPQPGDGKIEVYLTPWVHIFTYMYIRCLIDDTGVIVVPWDMLEQFPHDDLCGHGECGSNSHIARYSEDHITVSQGVVRLRLESRRSIEVNRPR